jgi:hypothetical protein
MATNIPLPSSGQPLDLTYLTTIASSINDLYALTNSSTFNKSSKIAPATNKQTTSELIFAAERVKYSVAVTAAKGLTSATTWSYGGVTFTIAPVVQITVEFSGSPATQKSIIPIINSVSNSQMSYQFYSVDGITTAADYFVHITAIGY